MGLETGEPEDWKPWRRRLSTVWRWLWLPVDFWRAMEVLGLWVAAAVGIAAINSSNRDSREQVRAMRDQLQVMGGQLKEMQEEGRAWVGPVGAQLVNKNPEEPLKISLAYRNFGNSPLHSYAIRQWYHYLR